LLTVIGKVASLHDQLSWFESLPLFGKTVLVTRTREQASALSALLRRAGARAVELPALELAPLPDEDGRAAAHALGLGEYDWCVFTSANAVAFFWRCVEAVGWDARAFKCQIAAIGRATAAALRERSLVADVVASESTSEGLLRAIEEWAAGAGARSLPVERWRFLYPRAAGGRDVLAHGLRDQGASVDEVVLYEARVPAAA